LEFIDEHRRKRQFILSAADAQGDGVAVRTALAERGFILPYHSRRAFLSLLTATPVIPQENGALRCADRTGWHVDAAGKLSYVLPDRTIGGNVILHTEHTVRPRSAKGTVDEWREHIAARIINGDPRPTLTLSAAFAGTILSFARMTSVGLHFVGPSSIGKTTLAILAASVQGDPSEVVRSWNITVAGIEGAAAESSDGVLILDEINACNPHDVERLVYSLGNGTGRQRANVRGGARIVRTWRAMTISTGERDLSEILHVTGRRQTTAGAGLRMLHIPAQGAYGVFNNLPDNVNGRRFADGLVASARKYHGTAGPAFIEKLAADPAVESTIGAAITKAREALGETTSEQEGRAASVLATIAAAGELATRYELTGWGDDQATHAAKAMFEEWKAARGKGNEEDRQAVEAVRDFIIRHGESSFTALGAHTTPIGGERRDRHGLTIINRTETVADPARAFERRGWYRYNDDAREWLLTSEAMHEATHGLNFRTSVDALVRARMLRRHGKEAMTQVKIEGTNRRVYIVSKV
jgi:putative DNA primase/helicase